MRTLMRRFSLLGVLALIASLTVAGFAVASEHGGDDAPFASDVDDTFTWSFNEDENTIYWSLDENVNCDDPNAPDADCNETQVEPSDGEDANHGDIVSAFANDPLLEKGPGVGCLIAAVATSDEGKPEESTDSEGQNEDKGCPAGLYDWLQTFTGENAGDGPPPFVQEKLDEMGVGAEGNGNGNIPDHVPGPPPGAGPGNNG